MVSRVVKLSGSFSGGSIIVHSSSGDSSTIDLSSYSGTTLIETTINITDGNDYWFEYNISSTDYVNYVTISNEPSTGFKQKSSASSLDGINHITSQSSILKASSSQLEVYPFTTLTTSIPTKTQTNTLLKTSSPFTTSISQVPDYTDISSNTILESILLTAKASKYREYISRLVGVRKVIANITDYTKIIGSNLQSKNGPKPTRRYLTVNIQGTFPSRNSYIHIISNTGQRRTIGLSNYQRTGPEYLLNFTTEPVSYQKDLNIDDNDTLDSIELKPTTVPDISPIISDSIPLDATASNITVGSPQYKTNITSRIFVEDESADILSTTQNISINSKQIKQFPNTISNALVSKQSSDGNPINIPRTISSDSNTSIGLSKPLDGTHIGKESGWKIVQKNPSEYPQTGPILHQDNVEVHPYSINIELTVSNTDKQWLETLEKDAQKLTSNVDFRGESLIADTSDNTNTYKLYPKEIQSPGIQEGEYHVQEYSETAKGSNSELYRVSIKFIRSFSYESIDDYSDTSKQSNDWKFSINSSDIYTQKVDKTFDISSSREGVESYNLDVVLSGKQASVFTNFLSNTKGLTFVNSRDGPNYSIDYTKENKNKIYIEPPEDANFKNGIYTVHNWKSSTSGEYHSVELSLSYVRTGTIQSSFDSNRLTASGNTFINSLTRLMEAAPTVVETNPLTAITSESSEENKTITDDTLVFIQALPRGSMERVEKFIGGSHIQSDYLSGIDLIGEYVTYLTENTQNIRIRDKDNNYVLDKDVEGIIINIRDIEPKAIAYVTIEHSESISSVSGSREMRQYVVDDYGDPYDDDYQGFYPVDAKEEDVISSALGDNFVYTGHVPLNIEQTPTEEYEEYEANDGNIYDLTNHIATTTFEKSTLTVGDLNGRIPISYTASDFTVASGTHINPPGTDFILFYDIASDFMLDTDDVLDAVTAKIDENYTKRVTYDEENGGGFKGYKIIDPIQSDNSFEYSPGRGVLNINRDENIESDFNVPNAGQNESVIVQNTFGDTATNIITDDLSTYTINNPKLQTYNFSKSQEDLAPSDLDRFVPYTYDFSMYPTEESYGIQGINDVILNEEITLILGDRLDGDKFLISPNNVYSPKTRKIIQQNSEEQGIQGYEETAVTTDRRDDLRFEDIKHVHVDDNIILLTISNGIMKIIDRDVLQSTHSFTYMTNEVDFYSEESQREIWYSLKDLFSFDEEVISKGSIRYEYNLGRSNIKDIVSLSSEEFLLFYNGGIIKMYIDKHKAYIKNEKAINGSINYVEEYNNNVYIATSKGVKLLKAGEFKIRSIAPGNVKYIKVNKN